ncbi:MAG: HNH endonuclease, partial [SAR324 cluster bacterium]|nr:HNH endonuclease [SAR324 cluster bacterium]
RKHQSDFRKLKGDKVRYQNLKKRVSDWNKTEDGRISRSLAYWNRIARMAGHAGVSKKQWMAILLRYGNKCAYCGAEGKMTIDHVIPVFRGGIHAVDNVVPACSACNSKKHYKSIQDQIGRHRQIRLPE